MKVFCVMEVITDAGKLSQSCSVELRRVCATMELANQLIELLEKADAERGQDGAYVVSEDEVYE